MEQFNKVISFVLGLVVVVIFIAVATGKINLKGKILPSSGASSSKGVTPTPTKAMTTQTLQYTSTPSETKGGLSAPSGTTSTTYHSYGSVGNVSAIPSTGPELLIPMALSAFLGGSFLKKAGKKD